MFWYFNIKLNVVLKKKEIRRYLKKSYQTMKSVNKIGNKKRQNNIIFS